MSEYSDVVPPTMMIGARLDKTLTVSQSHQCSKEGPKEMIQEGVPRRKRVPLVGINSSFTS